MRCSSSVRCCLLLGIIAGVGNREVLDGSRFATHVDHIRTDPEVSRQVGIVISDKLIAEAPDLTVARPLVESTAGVWSGARRSARSCAPW